MLWTQEYRRWIRRGPVLVGLVAFAMSVIVVRSVRSKPEDPNRRDRFSRVDRWLLGAGTGNGLEHSIEHEIVKWIKCIPVGESQQAIRIKNRRLPDRRAFFVPFHLELQPSSSRDLHFCR